MLNRRSKRFVSALKILNRHNVQISLGQSVDTSVIHKRIADFRELPVLTSVGCAIRRPKKLLPKFNNLLRDHVGAEGRLMVDSGGFVLMNNPEIRWDVDDVVALYQRLDADWLIALDRPAHAGDKKEEREAKYQTTLENLRRMRSIFGNRLVPVLHGLTEEELNLNASAVRQICGSCPLVGLGGLVPTLQKCGNSRRSGPQTPQRRIAMAVRIAREYFPESQLHLFGVGSLHTVLGCVALGVGSVDSIGWRQAAGFGSVYIPGLHRRLLTNRHREKPCRPYANRYELELLGQCRCPACRGLPRDGGNIERLRENFRPRAVHNIWVLYTEIADFLSAVDRGEGHDFIASRLSIAWQDAIGM